MTKYSSKFKAKVVQEYLDGGVRYKDLTEKYHIADHSAVSSWVRRVQIHGMTSIKVRHQKRTYSQDYKMSVVDYIQTHEVSRAQTAAYFGISKCQVNHWIAIFRQQGVVGLRDKPCGRRPTMSKHKNLNNTKPQLTATKEEKYKQEITELKQELHDAELDRDILKTLAAITKKQPK